MLSRTDPIPKKVLRLVLRMPPGRSEQGELRRLIEMALYLVDAVGKQV